MPDDRSDYAGIFNEVEELKEAERKRLLADTVTVDPADYPASKMVMFRWYDRTLGRTVEEPFELRLLTHRERIHRARNAGLMAQINWALLPEDTQQYLLGICTSNILWPKASESWKRTITEREEVAINAFVAVENHRHDHFRGGDGAGGEDPVPMGLDVLPISTPSPNTGR